MSAANNVKLDGQFKIAYYRYDVKVKGTISPLCNPPPKLTVATGSQQQAITSRSGEVLSPLPSR